MFSYLLKYLCFSVIIMFPFQAEKEEQAAMQAERPIKEATEFASEPWGGGDVAVAPEVSDVSFVGFDNSKNMPKHFCAA